MKKKPINNIASLIESVNFIKEKVGDIDARTSSMHKTLNEHTKTLSEHTRQLGTITSDVQTIRQKRLQLEVRVDHVEKHLGLKPPAGTMSR